MLNKIKLIGKFLPSLSLKIREEIEPKEIKIYFSLAVPNPSGVITKLRCVTRGEIAKRIEKELQRDDIIEIRGYLRNERPNEKNNFSDKGEPEEQNRQILTKVTEFTKLNISFKEIDKNHS